MLVSKLCRRLVIFVTVNISSSLHNVVYFCWSLLHRIVWEGNEFTLFGVTMVKRNAYKALYIG